MRESGSSIKQQEEGMMKPVALMVLYEAATAGINVLYKLAAADGMEMKILIAYRYTFAAAFMTPLAFFLERRSRPKLTWTIAFHGFMSALLGGVVPSNLYSEGMVLTSATLVNSMFNLVPAATFVTAIIFRLENVSIQTWEGRAKVIGTALSIGGAMTLTLYKGFQLKLWTTGVELLHRNENSALSHSAGSNHLLGSLLAVASCVSWAVAMIFQTWLSQQYPCYSSAAVMSFSGVLQSNIYAICRERDWSAWKIGWDIRLISVAYAGIVYAGLMAVVVQWCTGRKGPVFVTSFDPLSLVFLVFIGAPFIHENLHLGSIIGSVFIITGLYMVLWGKSKELKKMAAQPSAQSKSLTERPAPDSIGEATEFQAVKIL